MLFVSLCSFKMVFTFSFLNKMNRKRKTWNDKWKLVALFGWLFSFFFAVVFCMFCCALLKCLLDISHQLPLHPRVRTQTHRQC